MAEKKPRGGSRREPASAGSRQSWYGNFKQRIDKLFGARKFQKKKTKENRIILKQIKKISKTRR